MWPIQCFSIFSLLQKFQKVQVSVSGQDYIQVDFLFPLSPSPNVYPHPKMAFWLKISHSWTSGNHFPPLNLKQLSIRTLSFSQGWKKKLNSSLSFGQAALTFCLPGQGHFLLIVVNYFDTGGLVWVQCFIYFTLFTENKIERKIYCVQ